MNKLIYIYITNPDLKTARRMANLLLDKKVIGCANIFPGVEAIFPWKGKRAREREVVLIAKTTADRYPAVKKLIEKNHPYSISSAVKIPVEANAQYTKWLNDVLSGKAK